MSEKTFRSMTPCSRLNKWRSFARSVFLALLLGVGALSASAEGLRQYTIRVSFPRGSVTGLCLIRTDSAGGAMSVVNEFGIKAFDAVYTAGKGKVKLLNVIGPLDRWIIRQGIAKDLSLFFDPERKVPRRRIFVRGEDGSMRLTNKRFKITYDLRPIEHAKE